ncbi:MAG: CAP domain-containing protein [Patescibacteria group bacterium]|nr:CAP domain-containing protein [Patescibacteria group bacterium]
MPRVYPPSFVKKQVLPDSDGTHRAGLIQRPALIAYFSFFALLFLTLVGLDAQFPGVLGYATDISSREVIELTNQERAKLGLSPLESNAVLKQAAEAKARDMFLKDYWAHNSPDGLEPWDFIDQAGYVYLSAGENLAKDFDHSASVVRAWMNSPTHRDNIANSQFEEIGVAVVNGELNGFKTTLVVQMFGTPQPSYLASVGGEESGEAAQVSVAGEELDTSQAEPQETEIELAPQESHQPSITGQAFAGTPMAQRFEDFNWRDFALTGGFVCAAFLAILFLLDAVVVSKRRDLRLTLRTLAHLAFLGFLLFGIWYSQVGTVL